MYHDLVELGLLTLQSSPLTRLGFIKLETYNAFCLLNVNKSLLKASARGMYISLHVSWKYIFGKKLKNRFMRFVYTKGWDVKVPSHSQKICPTF